MTKIYLPEVLSETLYVVELAQEDVIEVTRWKKKENARKSFPIPFWKKSCRRSLALLAGSNFWMKSIKKSEYSRRYTKSKNTMWPCMPERTTRRS